MGICKLCKTEKKLLKKSHIISDFLHTELFDEKQRLVAFKPNDLLTENSKVSTPLSAVYEGDILCQNCDGSIINTYETYISNVLKNNLSDAKKVFCKETYSELTEKIIEVKNLDYNKTKLFVLSQLWRCSISKRKEYLHVELGPYEEKLRLQILSGIASGDENIEISIFKLNPKANFSSFIAPPLKNKIDNSYYYTFILIGYVCIVHLKESRLSKILSPYNLKSDGSIRMFELAKENVGEFVMNFIGVKKK